MISQFLAFVAVMPIILPVWKEGPIPKNYLNYDVIGYKSTVEQIRFQKNMYKAGDPTFRMSSLRLLGLVHDSTDSAEVIYDFLKVEKDPVLRVAALDYLYRLPVIESRMKELESLINNQVNEGISAARLYIRFANADLKRVYPLLKGTTVNNKIRILQALAESKKVPVQTWIELSKQDKNYTYRSIAVKALAASENQTDKTLGFIKTVLTKAKDHERAFTASSLVFNEGTSAFFPMMSSDKHATVRKAAANGMGAVKKAEFEKILIRMTQDRDTEVRKAAAASLKQYQTNNSVAALIKLFNDAELLNQKEAVASLMHISSSIDIVPAVAKAIDGTVGYRRWSAHILGNLKAKQHADQVEVQLRKEKDPHARAEQVYALGQFVHPLAANLVNSLSKDTSPLVRTQLVLYIAKINNEKFFPLIHNAAMKDPVGEVRWAALEGCGLNGSPWFNKTLMAIMLDLDVNNMRDAQDRACACWAAGKIKGLSKEMYMRMRTVMKEPTVPQIMGPKTFDESTVLISILFSFVDQYKMGDNEERKYKKWAEHFIFRFNGDRRSVDFPRNYHNDYYSLQGEKYLKNESVKPHPYPRRRVSWTLKSLKKEK